MEIILLKVILQKLNTCEWYTSNAASDDPHSEVRTAAMMKFLTRQDSALTQFDKQNAKQYANVWSARDGTGQKVVQYTLRVWGLYPLRNNENGNNCG
jgi:hypothetical protein